MNLMPAAQVPTLQVGPEAETLAAQLRSGGKQSVDAVATGFESMFMSLILKEMRQTLEPGMLFGQDSSDVQGGLFDLYLGQHLAQAGGLGIAKMVKSHLAPSPTSECGRSREPSGTSFPGPARLAGPTHTEKL
jgi:Rod binding domain-containing protein